MKFLLFVVLIGSVLASPLPKEESKDLVVKGIFDQWIDQVLKPSVITQAQTVAGLLAQVTAGVAIDGIPAIQGLFGKRSVDARGFLDDLVTGINNALYPVVNQAVQDLALQITQQLADFANGGSFGKRSVDAKGFWDDLATGINNALYPVVNQAVQDLALQITQQLADFANGGSFGKRSLDAATGINKTLVKRQGGATESGAFGKRLVDDQMRGIFDQWFDQVLKPSVLTQAQNVAGLLAQVTAGVGE